MQCTARAQIYILAFCFYYFSPLCIVGRHNFLSFFCTKKLQTTGKRQIKHFKKRTYIIQHLHRNKPCTRRNNERTDSSLQVINMLPLNCMERHWLTADSHAGSVSVTVFSVCFQAAQIAAFIHQQTDLNKSRFLSFGSI